MDKGQALRPATPEALWWLQGREGGRDICEMLTPPQITNAPMKDTKGAHRFTKEGEGETEADELERGLAAWVRETKENNGVGGRYNQIIRFT